MTAHTYNVKISMQYIFMLYRQGRSYLSKFALWAVYPLRIRQREDMAGDSQENRSCWYSMFAPNDWVSGRSDSEKRIYIRKISNDFLSWLNVQSGIYEGIDFPK